MDLKRIQAALRQRRIDGWLLCDFRNRDFLSYRVLGLDEHKPKSRRWYYYIPARGTPSRLVHAVEPGALDALPGRKQQYVAWTELHAGLKRILGAPRKSVAMQYSTRNNVPYIALVDAGTVELIRGFGHKVVSSADLVQSFVSVIGDDGYALHKEAARLIDGILTEAFGQIRASVANGGAPRTEYDVQQFIMGRFAEEKLTTYSPPMVGINDHQADPHFEVSRETARTFTRGDRVLIDLWAKKDAPGGIYYDITWAAYLGPRPPAEYQKIFTAARDGRDAAIAYVQDAISRGRPCHGWQVDDACRHVVKKAGYGKYFLHRTGHSIGEETHGTGVNIDNLETKDERELIPGCCFSIEPGIYLPNGTAVRTEINMFIRPNGIAEVTGEVQREMLTLI